MIQRLEEPEDVNRPKVGMQDSDEKGKDRIKDIVTVHSSDVLVKSDSKFDVKAESLHDWITRFGVSQADSDSSYRKWVCFPPRAFETTLVSMKLLESPLEANLIRLRWQCVSALFVL